MRFNKLLLLYKHSLPKIFTEISSSFLLDALTNLPTDDYVVFLRQTKLDVVLKSDNSNEER